MYYVLRIDDKVCRDCNDCTNVIPNMKEYLNEYGIIHISEYHMNKNKESIDSMIKGCINKAVILETKH